MNNIKKLWSKVPTRLLITLLAVAFIADAVLVYGSKDNEMNSGASDQSEVLLLSGDDTQKDDKENYIAQLEASLKEYEETNKRWVNAESQWIQMKANYESQVATLKQENNDILKKTVESFQVRINNLSMSMTDPSWQNSLLNDVTSLIPSPGNYTQDQATNDRKIALIHVYSWAGVGVCSVLDDYVKAGIISSRGESCNSRANIASQLK